MNDIWMDKQIIEVMTNMMNEWMYERINDQ